MSQDIDARLRGSFEQVLGPRVTAEVLAKPSVGHPDWDSVAHISLVMAVEQAFGVTFSPEEAGLTTSYEALRDTLTRKLGG